MSDPTLSKLEHAVLVDLRGRPDHSALVVPSDPTWRARRHAVAALVRRGYVRQVCTFGSPSGVLALTPNGARAIE